MSISSNEIYCNMQVFMQDISNVKAFIKSLSKYDIHGKGISWRMSHCGVMIEINFVTTNDKVDEIKKEYEEMAFDLYFGR